MANQATIDAALAFKTAMQLKTARRLALTQAVQNDNTLSPAAKAEHLALVQRDIDLHHDWYDHGTTYLPINFPQGGST